MAGKGRKTVITALLGVCLLGVSILYTPSAQAEPRWSNPNMSKEARSVLKYLYNVTGKHVIAGQHNYVEAPFDWSDKVEQMTGTAPGLWGDDFAWEELANERQSMVDAAIEAWNEGSLVTLTWHAERPSDSGPDANWWSVQGWYTDEEMKEVVTPGTEKYKQWVQQVDEIAVYLQQLEDAHVPVIWRPYHENNAGWFWWGGRPEQFKQLWSNLYDRLTNDHHLDNLIWNYNTNADTEWAESPDAFYPGDNYTDMVSVDIYDWFNPSYYEDMKRIAHGKPIAIGECGPLPDMETLQSEQPDYTYFMAWGNLLTQVNTEEQIRNVYAHPYTLTKNDFMHAVFK